MGICRCCCSFKFLIILSIISAVPFGIILSLERSKHSTHFYEYHSQGWMREGNKWDDVNNRFLVSYFEGGVGQILVPENHSSDIILQEVKVLHDSDLAGNASLGVVIDRPRNRLLVCTSDAMGFSYGALAAYDLDTWKRSYLTQLSGPGDEQALVDDVAVDPEGNAYVTDAKSSKIWKVGVNGELLSVIKSPLFTHKEWYKDLISLNGIVYHPHGYLLVIHTIAGQLYKIDPKTEEVKLVKVTGSLVFGDGIELFSPTKLIVAASYPSARMVESFDGWETATVVAKYRGPSHRVACAALIKDGRVYINHLFGLGFPKHTHAILEPVFTPIKPAKA